MHLKLCISQDVQYPDDGPSSSTTGFTSLNPSALAPGLASRHDVKCLDAQQRVAAADFIALETTDLQLEGGIFLPEICHDLSTHADTNKLIAAVSVAQFEDKQQNVGNPGLASPLFSTMECVTAPPSLAPDQSAQDETSAIASQDTAPLSPDAKKSAQIDSSAIASQDTAPLPPDAKKSVQIDSSAIARDSAAPSLASEATVTLEASMPLSVVESASADDIPQKAQRVSTTKKHKKLKTKTKPSHEGTVGIAPQVNSSKKSRQSLQKKVRASITSHHMPPKSTAQADPVHFIVS